jgi:hypothetical protein
MTSVVALTEILTVTVTPSPGSVQDTNLTKVAGTAVTTGSGASDAGTQRVVLSSDSVVSTKTNLTAQSPAFATVGVTSAQVVAANSARKGLVLVNNSTANISIAFAATAVSGSGVVLYPGGVFFMDEYMFTTSAVTAIATAAASNLGVQEWQ